MKLNFKKYTFFVLIVAFLCFHNIYALTELCCYNGDDANTIYFAADSCGGDKELVGQYNNNHECQFGDKKLGCMKSGVCYATVFHNYIYDFNEVYNYFKNDKGVDLATFCDDLIPFDGTICKNDYSSSVYVPTDENNEGSNVGGTGESISYDDVAYYESIIEQNQKLSCSQTGGPFNLFGSADSCNSFNDGSNYPCLYNPYLGGILKISSSDNQYNLFADETGCMWKDDIKHCSDYKSEELCLQNPLNDVNNQYYSTKFSKYNLNSCMWVPSGSFYPLLHLDSGVCISNIRNDGKDFNIDEYTNRMNLISNPSFEKGLVSWDFTGTVEVKELSNSYDGVNSTFIPKGSSISQRINFLDSGIAYRGILHLLEDESYTGKSKIYFSIEEYGSSGQSLGIYNNYELLSDYSFLDGVFASVVFDEHKITKGTSYLVVTIEADEDIVIDALSFEKTSSQNEGGKPVFKPLEIISSRASNCNLCFDDVNLNLCTKAKSDILGDCSYMVSDEGMAYKSVLLTENNYLGRDDYYYGNWTSQSIANAKLFCERYVHNKKDSSGVFMPGACEDPQNYVNSKYTFLHSFVGSTLCRWNDEYGCFKDSDGGLGPDTIFGGAIYLSVFDQGLTKRGWDFSYFSSYLYEDNSTHKSDFKYACDVVPPQVYVYFTGRNSSGGVEVIGDDFPSYMLGDIMMNVEAYDIKLDSCSDYNINNKLYVEYIVNGVAAAMSYSRASVAFTDDVKDFFVNSTGDLMLSEGRNDVKMFVKDQSGNIGKSYSFTMYVDLYGPNITLVDPPRSSLPDTFGKGQTFTFDVTDYSQIASCNFTLDAGSVAKKEMGGHYDDYYVSEGNLSDYSVSHDILNGKEYVFTLPINKTTINSNYYRLVVTCDDIFGQSRSESYDFFVDYNTSFVLLDPLSFINKDADSGFLNGVSDFWAVSTEQNIKSCALEHDGSVEYLKVDSVPEGFSGIGGYSRDIFYTNITGSISFEHDDVYNVTVSCYDNYDNKISENITYYYDTVLPQIVDFSIVDNAGFAGTVYNNRGVYYVRKSWQGNSGVPLSDLNISVNGSGSWMSDENLSLFYLYDGSFVEISSARFGKFNLYNDSFVGNILVGNYINLFAGVDIEDEKGLALYNLYLNFSDKAGNSNLDNFSFYFDYSSPDFEFGGDMFENLGTLYTKSNDPQVEVTFNTPSYRLWACNVTAKYSIGQSSWDFIDNYDYTNKLSFKFSDFIRGFEIKDGTSLNFGLDCRDIYGYELSEDFEVFYDNTQPQLNDVYFKDGNEKYLANLGSNMQYFSAPEHILYDTLVFDMTDTDEYGYTCSYRFKSLSDVYTCNDSVYDKDFKNPSQDKVLFEVKDIPILSYSPSSDSKTICRRNLATFNQALNDAYDNDDLLETIIKVDASCVDRVYYKTDNKTLNLYINYVAGNNFVDFDISYSQGKAVFKAVSLTPFDDVGVYLDALGQKKISSLTRIKQGDLYIYRGDYDLSEYKDSEVVFDVWAIGKDATGDAKDSIKSQIVVDNTDPTIGFVIPDMADDGSIYSSDFELFFDVKDLGGSNVGKVELYVDDDLVYDSEDLGGYDSSSINEPISYQNYYDEDQYMYFGRVVFNRGVLGGVYTFKVVAYDNFGNSDFKVKTVYVKDGVSIRLVDSTSASVDLSGYSWVSNRGAPVLSFRTSRQVDECVIYPFFDDIWSGIIHDSTILAGNKNILGGDVVNNTFSFDMSEIDGFDLGLVDESEVGIGVKCKYNKTWYNYTRMLYSIDALPDYVLTSSGGFVSNNNPYETTINIRSVGFFKPIRCNYTFDGKVYDFGGRMAEFFSDVISFRDLESGTYDLNLVCSNMVGMRGPSKTYRFVVNKDVESSVSDVALRGSSDSYALDENIVYVRDSDNLGLTFRANKDNLECEVEVRDIGNTIISKTINFVKNLFLDNTFDVSSDENSFMYNVEGGISFAKEGANKLSIICENKELRSFNIYYLNESGFEIALSYDGG